MVQPSTALAVLTFIFTLYIAYKSKATAVESGQDRQKLLTERCEGQKVIGDPTVIRIESVEFEPDRRGLKGWLFEEHPGSSVVTMSFLNVFVAPSFLEQLGEEPDQFGDVKAEELGTKVVGDTVMTNWRIQTNNPDEIREFVRGFANASDSGLKEGRDYVQLTKKTKIS